MKIIDKKTGCVLTQAEAEKVILATFKKTRLTILNDMKENAVQKKLFAKLKKSELTELENFVIENENLNENDYAFKVNRWFLDQKNKPKNHSTMWALASQCKKQKENL